MLEISFVLLHASKSISKLKVQNFSAQESPMKPMYLPIFVVLTHQLHKFFEKESSTRKKYG
jgi:hypothetical protein